MPVSDFIPDMDAVANLERTRTVDPTGAETGTFSDVTRPTEDQARSLMANAAEDVAMSIGETVPDVLLEPIKRITALRTAMLIELTLFPEQIDSEQSPYVRWKTLYDEMLPILIERVQTIEEEEDIEDGTLSPGMAQFYFPPNAGGLVGWDTVM